MEYQVIVNTMPDFETMVEDAIKRGWTLQGGATMCMLPNAIVPCFCQALVKTAMHQTHKTLDSDAANA